MGQLGFEGMPQRLYTCTPSRLASWVDCPRRYRMTYLDRPQPPKGPPWGHNSLGASVHGALAAWWRLPPEQRTTYAAQRLVDQGWISLGFRDDQQAEQVRARAREMVADYVAELDPYDEPVGIERVVATRTQVLALSGRVDRLDDRDGELVVVDYKTGRHALTVDDARGSMALALYAICTRQVLRRPCYRVELHHLPTGEVLGWEHDDHALQRQLRRAEQIGAEAAAADAKFRAGLSDAEVDEVFPPQPGPQCRYCDFAQHCPEGSTPYPTNHPWAGLAEAVPAD
ncbi:MAG: recombinase RecB [Streptosporangiales bacterium]|nr:recombinase RecB [Streptosporangiales bacterium]